MTGWVLHLQLFADVRMPDQETTTTIKHFRARASAHTFLRHELVRLMRNEFWLTPEFEEAVACVDETNMRSVMDLVKRWNDKVDYVPKRVSWKLYRIRFEE